MMNVLGELGLGACHMLAVTMSPVTDLVLVLGLFVLSCTI
jgi:hypothetical protein